MKKILLILSSVLFTLNINATTLYEQVEMDDRTEVVIGFGRYTYAIYCDGMLVCWVKADSLTDADTWAKQTYGPSAYARLHNSLIPSL